MLCKGLLNASYEWCHYIYVSVEQNSIKIYERIISVYVNHVTAHSYPFPLLSVSTGRGIQFNPF